VRASFHSSMVKLGELPVICVFAMVLSSSIESGCSSISCDVYKDLETCVSNVHDEISRNLTRMEQRLAGCEQKVRPWIQATSAFAPCTFSASWMQIMPMIQEGRVVTGGLGAYLEEGLYEIWLCDKAHLCAPPEDAMCFIYNESDQHWIPWGINSDLKLISELPSRFPAQPADLVPYGQLLSTLKLVQSQLKAAIQQISVLTAASAASTQAIEAVRSTASQAAAVAAAANASATSAAAAAAAAISAPLIPPPVAPLSAVRPPGNASAAYPGVLAAAYGVAADGRTDDTAALQAAVDAAAAGCLTVLLPAGLMRTSGPILVPAGVMLQGQGPGGDPLQMLRAGSGSAILFGRPAGAQAGSARAVEAYESR
jgi:hypothetical protein